MTCKYVQIPKEDTYALIRAAQGGDENARELIVDQNTGLVKNLSLKFLSSGYELEDLLQIGFIGLLKAIDKFDQRFDVMFSTYAVPMILGEIKRYIRDDGKIKVSRQLKSDIRNLMHLQEEYYNKRGYQPKLSELSEMMGVTIDRVVEILEARDSIYSIESLDNPERQGSMAGAAEPYGAAEEKTVDMIYLKTIIRELSERERQVIVLRYFKDMTQQQIAGKIGISQVQVSRIEKKVLENLRKEFVE